MNCHTNKNGGTVRKKGFRSKKFALHAMYRLANSRGIDSSKLSVYKCPECKMYHVGHTPEREERENGERYPGVVRWFDVAKGYGFIGSDNEGDPELFLHISEVIQGYPERGRRATFEIEEDERGRGYRATNVVVI